MFRIPFSEQTQSELRKGRLGKFKGITFSKASSNWIAQLKSGDGKAQYLGSFAYPDSAARRYDEALRARDGEMARTNEALGYLDAFKDLK
jgi:hypothetical protein